MTPAEIEGIYILQSENVRHLGKVLNALNRDINRSIEQSNEFELQYRTKIIAFVYSAWSEAQFVQIIHTPRGFYYPEINDIKNEKSSNGVFAGWKLMLEKAMTRVGDTSLRQDLSDRLTKLLEITDEYIGEPSIVRNKIAHGQWINVLNRHNTAKNDALTNQLTALDPVLVMKRKRIHQLFGFIVRDLVQSPLVGFHRHYWTNIVELESFLNRSKDWTLELKKLKLQANRRRT